MFKSKRKKQKKETAPKIPKTLSDSIPYERVYKNGVIEIQSCVFSKSYILPSVNYKTRGSRVQGSMAELYAEMIGSFDPDITVEISGLQTSYAKDMEEFGLERGLEGSQARHQDIKKYYAGLNRGIEVDPPKENESALEYHNRILDQIQELQADSMRRRDEADREARRKVDEERIQQRKILERELLTAKSSISTDIDKLYKEKNDTEKEIALLHSQKAQIEKTVHDLQMQVDDFYKQQAFVQENIGKIEKYEYIEAQYRRLLQSDPEQAEMINSLLLAGNNEKEQENTII